MAHHTARKGYVDLVGRLNRHPQGAPPSELLYRILEMLFSEREAALVAELPIRPFDAAWAAKAWKMPLDFAQVVLDELASRVITPVNSTRRAVAMAVERGKLQNLIFDNHGLTSHRVMASPYGTKRHHEKLSHGCHQLRDCAPDNQPSPTDR